MARRTNSLLGIDLHSSEIRIVQVRYRGSRPSLMRAESAPMPKGVSMGGRVTDPGAIAVGIRQILDRMGIQDASSAVVGIAEGVTLRTMMVPGVAESELPMVVAAEAEHQSMMGARGGTLDYIKLAGHARGDEGFHNVVAFSVDDETTALVRTVLDGAGLTVAALEPSLFAMYRAAALTASPPMNGLALMVGPTFSEIALAANGKLIAYRRLETGSRELLTGRSAFFASASTPQIVAAAYENEPAQPAVLVGAGVEALVLELERTLDFFRREYEELAAAERIYLAVDEAALAPLGPDLALRFGMPVEMVHPATPNDNPQVKSQMEGQDGVAYCAAFGLAMREAHEAVSRVGRVDLYSKERSAREVQTTKRNFAGSIAISVTAAVLGLAGYLLYARQISQLKTEAAVQTQKAESVRGQTGITLAQRARRLAQYRALQKEGVPLDVIMDSITAALDPGAGLSSLGIDTGLRLNMQGDAKDEGAMIRSAQAMGREPVLGNIVINDFNNAVGAGGVQFHFLGQTVAINRVRGSAADTANAQAPNASPIDRIRNAGGLAKTP